MDDQAQSLRKMAAKRGARPKTAAPLRTLAVTSGKGGVGKTNLVVNLGIELSRLGRKVLIIDADLGLANVDVVLGINPEYTLHDVIHGEKNLSDIIVTHQSGMQILPAASGVSEMSNLSSDEKLMILQELDGLQTTADIVIIDTAAGISDTVLYFNIAAQERLVVATGEPTSLTDAYALIKVLHLNHQEKRFKLVVNNVPDLNAAKQVYRKLAAATEHFLSDVSLDYLGYVPSDPAVNQAVMRQTPLAVIYPDSPAARGIRSLAKSYLAQPVEGSGGNIKFFWRRLVDMA